MGVLADKEYRRMIQIMFRPGDKVFTVTPKNNPRALDGGILAQDLAKYNVDAFYCETGEEAVSCAFKEAAPEDVILAFGSLSNLKEIRIAYEKVTNQRL